MKTECGVFGIFSLNKNFIFEEMITGLKQIQHRGQESCGISISYNDYILYHKGNGLIDKVMNNCYFKKYKINSAISHVRYSTFGSKEKKLDYVQPLVNYFNNEKFSISFNGNIPIMKKMYPNLELDTYGIIKFINESNDDFIYTLLNFQNKFSGVFCILILYKNEIYIIRDRYGVRPLSIGINKNKNSFCVSSETVSFDAINYKFIKNVEKGDIIKIGFKGIELIYNQNTIESTKCLFEYIYFSNPNSYFDNISINDFREFTGRQLAINDFDDFFFNSSYTTVVGCPNSGIISGKSYADKSNLIYKQIIKKNKYANRTFIMSTQEERIEHLKQKYYFEKKDIENQVIIIVDDSIVRGNTLNILLQQLKLCNPKEIHMRISSPPVISNCYYGIDIPTKEELIYNKYNSEENLTKYYNINSFKYLPLKQILEKYNNNFCISCFNGKYNKDILNW